MQVMTLGIRPLHRARVLVVMVVPEIRHCSAQI
jgi:hypothetical protein